MAAETKVINPFDNRVIATVPAFTRAGVQAAVGRAAQAGPELARMPVHERAAMLHRSAALINDQADSLARLIARESGKPIYLARTEVAQTAGVFALAAGEASHLHGESIAGLPHLIGSVMRVPGGIVAAFTRYTFPLGDVARQLASALAAGCPLVVCPSELAPLTALRLGDLLENAGLPKGAFEIVLGGDDLPGWLVGDARIAHIAYAGSPHQAGQIIRLAGLRRVSLALDRASAALIDADASMSHAVARCAEGAFTFSGQFDHCVRRIYVHQSLYDDFRSYFLDAVGRLVIGNPLQDATHIGPLMTDAAADLAINMANGAIEEGAWLLAGGEREGRLVAPLVLENVDPAMQIMRESVIGPLVCLLPFEQFDDALTTICRADMQPGIFTRDVHKALRAAECPDVRSVAINDVPARQDSAASIRRAVDSLTALKLVVINPAG